MGDMADDISERGMEAWAFFCRDFIRERIPIGHWRTRQGDDLLISEMSKPHLENTIKKVKGNVLGVQMRLQLVIDLPQKRIDSGDKTQLLDDTLYELIYKRTTSKESWESPFTGIQVKGKFYVTEIKGPEFKVSGFEITEPVVTAQLLGDIDLIDEDGEIIYRIR